MMTLDEAIRQAEARATAPGYTEEYRQLAEWLKELKELRERMAIIHQACTAARAATNFAELGKMPLRSNAKTTSEAYAAYKDELYRRALRNENSK